MDARFPLPPPRWYAPQLACCNKAIVLLLLSFLLLKSRVQSWGTEAHNRFSVAVSFRRSGALIAAAGGGGQSLRGGGEVHFLDFFLFSR